MIETAKRFCIALLCALIGKLIAMGIDWLFEPMDSPLQADFLAGYFFAASWYRTKPPTPPSPAASVREV